MQRKFEFNVSPSSLNLYERCRRSFYYQYILKLRTTEADSFASVYGIAIHNSVARVIQEKNSDLLGPKTDDMQTIWEEELSKQILKSKLSLDLYQLSVAKKDGVKLIKNCLHMFKIFDVDYSKFVYEEKVLLETDNVKLKGYLDIREENIIHELKSTVDPKKFLDFTQPVFYAFMHWRKTKIIPIVNVMFLKALYVKRVTAKLGDFKRLLMRIKKMVVQTNEEHFERTFNGCRWCQYKEKCFNEDWKKIPVYNSDI